MVINIATFTLNTNVSNSTRLITTHRREGILPQNNVTGSQLPRTGLDSSHISTSKRGSERSTRILQTLSVKVSFLGSLTGVRVTSHTKNLACGVSTLHILTLTNLHSSTLFGCRNNSLDPSLWGLGLLLRLVFLLTRGVRHLFFAWFFKLLRSLTTSRTRLKFYLDGFPSVNRRTRTLAVTPRSVHQHLGIGGNPVRSVLQ